MTSMISVIITTYNRSQFILRAIHSVLNQTIENYEIIVIDDGSTDDTSEVLASLIQTKKIKYFYQQNKGVSAARNAGVQFSRGEYLSFLDSDDEWNPYKLKSQLDFLLTNKQFRIVYTDEIWMRNNIRVNQKIIHKKSGGNIFRACIQQCLIAPSSVLIEKKLFEEMLGFDESYIVCEDYDLWLKISSLYHIGYINEPLIVKYGGHYDQLSRKYFAMDLWRIKSMANILNTRTLNKEDKEYVLAHLKSRASILQLGNLKHNNIKDYAIIDQILTKIE